MHIVMKQAPAEAMLAMTKAATADPMTTLRTRRWFIFLLLSG